MYYLQDAKTNTMYFSRVVSHYLHIKDLHPEAGHTRNATDSY